VVALFVYSMQLNETESHDLFEILNSI